MRAKKSGRSILADVMEKIADERVPLFAKRLRTQKVNVDRPSRCGFVYLIRASLGDQEFVKIGQTTKADLRLKEIAYGFRPFAVRVELIACQNVLNMNRIEGSLHKHFEAKRVCGEWFDLTTVEVIEAKKLLRDNAG